MLQQSKRTGRATRIGLGWAIHRGLIDEGKPHSHDALQIICMREKTLGVDLGDATVWGGTILIHRGIRHAVHCPTGIPSTLFLDPDIDVAKGLAAMAKGRTVVRLTGRIEIATRKLVQSLNEEEEKIQRLYDELARLCGRPRTARARDPRVQTARAALVEGHREKWPLTGLAKNAGLSNKQFAHLFTKCTGLPLRTHVRWLRFQTAIQSVARGDDLTAAAANTGYSDALQLKHAFHRLFGLSPLAFASMLKLDALTERDERDFGS